MKKRIAVFVGSLRKESFNRKIAKALISLAPSSLDMEIIEIGQLPLYNQDFDSEGKPPESWVQFREKVKTFDGVLFATAEYNRSTPAVLKNALDVGSQPAGHNIWDKKPGAIISASPGAMGGFGANHHIRQSLVFLNIPCMQQPEAYLSGVSKLMDDKGNITNDDTKKFLKKFIESYATWVETITIAKP